jgi:hypothetical protein
VLAFGCVLGLLHGENRLALAGADHVLFLHSLHQDHGMSRHIESSITATMKAKGTFVFSREHLDGERCFEEGYDAELVALFKAKYRGLAPKLIFCLGDEAMSLCRQHPSLFQNRPIVFICDEVFDSALCRGLEHRTAVVDVCYSGERLLSLVGHLQGQASELVFLRGPNLRSDHFVNELVLVNRKHLGPPHSIIELSSPDWLERVEALQPRAALIFTCLSFEDMNHVEVSRLTVERSRAPCYGLYEEQLGLGFVGGLVVSLSQQGALAAELGLKCLSSEPPLGQSDVMVTKLNAKEVCVPLSLEARMLPWQELPSSISLWRHEHRDEGAKSWLVLLTLLISSAIAFTVCLIVSLKYCDGLSFCKWVLLGLSFYGVTAMMIVALWQGLSTFFFPKLEGSWLGQLALMTALGTALVVLSIMFYKLFKWKCDVFFDRARSAIGAWAREKDGLATNPMPKEIADIVDHACDHLKAQGLCLEESLAEKHKSDAENEHLIAVHKRVKVEVRRHIESILASGRDLGRSESERVLTIREKKAVIERECTRLVKVMSEFAGDISKEKDRMERQNFERKRGLVDP